MRSIDGPITFAEDLDAPELMCATNHHFVMKGNPRNAFGRGRYEEATQAEVVRPGWRHSLDIAAEELRPEDVHAENVRRLSALWLNGHNRDEARGVSWPYDGSPVTRNAVMWFHREKDAEIERRAQDVRAREVARQAQAERERRQQDQTRSRRRGSRR
ncbi:hypothetical protein JNUCC0626_19920 [Lentzea sp. JNUCC 0626]|uniref:hypothetical protein n=1 Tax=Lentzea sp. JNUCC 0626 TaxID=3367513 RepID=UPI003749B11D